MSTAESSGTLLVFDGDCAFCTSSVDVLRRMLPRFPRAVPWQWLDLDAHGLDLHDVTRFAWVLTPSRQFAGHLALSALLRMQPTAGWRLLGHLLATLPFSLLAAVGYRLLAANRHLMPGGTPACARAGAGSEGHFWPSPATPAPDAVSASGPARLELRE